MVEIVTIAAFEQAVTAEEHNMQDAETTDALKRRPPHPIPGWEEAARRLLRVEMTKRNWRYQRLAMELKTKLGIVETTEQLTRKVNRGKFSAGFLLACLEVMGISDIQMADVRKFVPANAANK